MTSEQEIRKLPMVTIFSRYAVPGFCSMGTMGRINEGFVAEWKKRLSHVPYNISDHQQHPEEALAQLREAEIILSDVDLIGPVFSRLPQTKWIQGTQAGIDAMMKIVDPKDIPPPFVFTRLGRGLRTSMAEYVIGHMIAHERSFAGIRKEQEQKLWCKLQRRNYRLLGQLTLGIIGLGDIGEEIARLCKAFGMNIWGLGRRDLPPEKISKNVDKYRQISGLAELLAHCDYICSVLPLTPATNDMLSGDVLSCCTKQPVFINVGRGNVISEEAIMNALENGWISHAILDVFSSEPLSKDSPLWSSPKVTITPHCAVETFPDMLVDIMEENYNRYIHGEPLKYAVDWKLGY